MFSVSKAYKEAITKDGREFRASVRINDKVYDGSTLISIDLEEATNHGDNFTVGALVSTKLTVQLKNLEAQIFENAKVEPSIGLLLPDGTYEDVPLGIFYVTKPTITKEIITLECYDGVTKLEFGFFPSRESDSISSFMAQIANGTGLQIKGSFPPDIVTMPAGITYRKAVAWIAAYMGAYARFDRTGALEISRYTGTVTEIDAGSLFAGEELKTAVDFLEYGDIAPAIAKKPGQPLKVTFQLWTDKPSTVLIYGIGKHNIGQWYAKTSGEWGRYEMTIVPEEADATKGQTTLLFATPGMNTNISVRNITMVSADGSNVDHGAFSFKVIDGKQFGKTKLAENEFQVGRLVSQEGAEVITAGGAGNEVQVDCPFMTQARLNTLLNELKAIRYLPYSVTYKGDPAVQAGDRILLIDELGRQHNTLVMKSKLRFRGSVQQTVEAVGQTAAMQEFKPYDNTTQKIASIAAEIIHVRDLIAQTITVDHLQAMTARIDDLYATRATIAQLETDYLKATDADIKYASIERLAGIDAEFENLGAIYAKINDLEAVRGHVSTLQAGQAQIADLVAGKLSAEDLTAEFLKARLSTLTDAWITNAMIDTASVDRLMVTEANIESTAILDAFIKNLSASVITTGVLDAGRIGANTITVDKLESGIAGKLGIVSKEEISLEISTTLQGKPGGTNLLFSEVAKTPLTGTDMLTFDLPDLEANTDYVFSFNLTSSNAGPVLIYSVSGADVGNYYAYADSTEKRFAFSFRTSALAKGTKLVFNGLPMQGTLLTADLFQLQKGTVATAYQDPLDIYVEKTGVKNAINLSPEGIRIDGNHLKITAATTIDDAVIYTAHIAEAAITTAKIQDLAVTSAKIAALAVDTAKIADAAITTAKIDKAAITTTQIADGSITDAKIVELTANKITAGTLSVERLEIRGSQKSIVYAINSLGGLQSASVDTIDGGVLTEKSITADKIVAKAITAAQIASKTITANEIIANAITADSGIIADAAITTAKIATAAITNAKIDRASADKLTIVTADIQDAAITTAKIKDLSVTDAKIVNLNATKITADWIEGGVIKAGSLRTSMIRSEDWQSLDLSSNTSINLAVTDVLETSLPEEVQKQIEASVGEKLPVNVNNLLTSDVDMRGDIFNVFTTAEFHNALSAGEWYTLTFNLSTDKAGTVLIYSTKGYNIGNHYAQVGTTGGRFYIHFQPTAGTGVTDFIVNGLSTGGQVGIVGMTLTKGKNLPTSYTDYVQKNRILAAINLSNETVSIDGRWLHITAQTTIDDASIDQAAIRNLVVTDAMIQNLSASKITSGQLDAARIGAKTITANHLAADVGSSLDLSSNTSITLSVQRTINETLNVNYKNLIVNGAMEEGSAGWVNNGAVYTPNSEMNYYRLSTLGSTVSTPAFTLESGKNYYLSNSLRLNFINGITIRISFVTESGAHIVDIGDVNALRTADEWTTGVSKITPTLFPAAYGKRVRIRYEVLSRTDTRAVFRVTRVQVEQAENASDYVYTPTDGSFNLISAINLTPNGVRISGMKNEITGTTYIANGVINTAHIADAAITNAQIRDATITNAKIESLSASKIKAGILMDTHGKNKWDLVNSIMTMRSVKFQPYEGASSYIDITEGVLTAHSSDHKIILQDGSITLTRRGQELDSSANLVLNADANLVRSFGSDGGFNSSGWSASTDISRRRLFLTAVTVSQYTAYMYKSTSANSPKSREYTLNIPDYMEVDIRSVQFGAVTVVGSKHIHCNVLKWNYTGGALSSVTVQVFPNDTALAEEGKANSDSATLAYQIFIAHAI